MKRTQAGAPLQGGLRAVPKSGARQAFKVGAVALTLAAGWYGANVMAAGDQPTTTTPTPAVEAAPKPEGLKGIPVPTPSNLGDFVVSKSAAVRLGKALFWDMQVGSDGKTACASCHFNAGSDSRSKNQLNPGPDGSFQLAGPNYQFKKDDFPFHKLSDPENRDSTVIRTLNDVSGSAGQFNETFVSAPEGASADVRNPAGDATFNVKGIQTRKTGGRNAPTNINAVFNFRNFYDGRAQYLFNGVNPFGARDENARVYKNVSSLLSKNVTPVQVRIDNASLASQASGPPLNHLEMTANGRNFMDIGKRLLKARPLAQQKVSSSDSVLGAYVNTTGVGLKTATYEEMVKSAFKTEWWDGAQVVQVNPDGTTKVVAKPSVLGSKQYTQMQANFSLFFALAIQMYESTLVSDDAPFDRYMAGNSSAMTRNQALGMGVFFGKGKCATCHGGAEFTNASVRATLREPLQRMVMGDGKVAVYDEGFYNTAVRLTAWDIANGASDPFGRPISNTGLAQKVGSAEFKRLIGISPNISVSPGERIAVNGAFKTPTVRNVELTAPFFSNGGVATLRDVVEFYDRGGNFAHQNMADLDPDIVPLGLTQDEKSWLVDFMIALTDDRVRLHKAPFDHPQLFVNNGHTGDHTSVVNAGNGEAKDDVLELPAVGASGLKPMDVPKNFLGIDQSGNPIVSVRPAHSNKCLDIYGGSTSSGGKLVQWGCSGANNQRFQLVHGEDGGKRLYAAHSGKNLEVPLSSTSDGKQLEQATAIASRQQYWKILDAGNGLFQIYNQQSNKCMDVYGSGTQDGAMVVQWTCKSLSDPGVKNQLFKLY